MHQVFCGYRHLPVLLVVLCIMLGCGSGHDELPPVSDVASNDLKLQSLKINDAEQSHGAEFPVLPGSPVYIEGTLVSSEPLDQRTLTTPVVKDPSKTPKASWTPGRKYLMTAHLLDIRPNPEETKAYGVLQEFPGGESHAIKFSGEISVPEEGGTYDLRISASAYPENNESGLSNPNEPKTVKFGPSVVLRCVRVRVAE
jgi:hypothetical protein